MAPVLCTAPIITGSRRLSVAMLAWSTCWWPGSGEKLARSMPDTQLKCHDGRMAAPEGKDSADLQLIIGIHQDEIFCVQNAHYVAPAALVHRYAREACMAPSVMVRPQCLYISANWQQHTRAAQRA